MEHKAAFLRKALCRDDDLEKRKVTANCHGIENADRKMRCAWCSVVGQCMWEPDEGHVYLHDSDPYGPICFKCCACERPPPYNYTAQVLRSKVADLKVTDRVAEYSFEACALYARWLQTYSRAREFQDEHPTFTPATAGLTMEQRKLLIIAEAPSRQEQVQEALGAFADPVWTFYKKETSLARTSHASMGAYHEDLERRAREQAFLEECPEAYGLDLTNLVEGPDGQLRLMVMAGRSTTATASADSM